MRVHSPQNSKELFERLRRGEAAALNELFRLHYVSLCRTAVRFVRDEAAAEDIVQEFFTHLWDRRRSLPELTGGVESYLRSSVRNRSLNFLRDRKRIPVDDGELPERPSPADQPGEAMERAELQQRINRAVDRLPERCRLVFVMSKLEHMSQREIADQLGISTKTVENQMTRAYRFLREWLALIIPIIGTF